MSMTTMVQPHAAGAAGSAQAPEVSVIVPLGSRYEELDEICLRLRRVLTGVVGRYEVIFVDDASGPEARQQLAAVSRQFGETRIIRLQRRMGEATALAVGAHSARGAWLITLDPYLHVAVEELPRLLAPLRDGMDLVCAWRFPRRETGMSRWASDAFNAVARWLTKLPVHDLNCRVRAMKREVLDQLPVYGDLYRFLPIFASRRGYAWCEVQVPQQEGKRELGALGPGSYLGRFFDLLTLAFLTRFVKRPLHFFGLLGAIGLALGTALSLHLAWIKLVAGEPIGHRPLLLLAVLLIVVGVQIASIGLLGELMIFTHARDLKDYVIQEEQG
jgi:glycosyltransferase involved in cell wall biosynthesis